MTDPDSALAQRLASDADFREQYSVRLADVSESGRLSYNEYRTLYDLLIGVMKASPLSESQRRQFQASLKSSAVILGVMHALPEIRMGLNETDKAKFDSMLSSSGDVSAARWYLQSGKNAHNLRTAYDITEVKNFDP